jgi:DNA (cytosine-5)-methyltransferase 1
MGKPLSFGSVCSGIEAASVAWEPLGFRAAFLSEIEAFPSAVLAHHYPDVPNRGDMTRFAEWPDDAIDLLVGGTPCQSFSVAGLRAGLADPRGNLMLTYLAIAAKLRPRWLVWENVPGVLSSNGGRDFGTFLRGLGELGYGFAYRVLDAQFCRASGLPFAVPQRRRRVFVVGHSGDWRRAAAVLFDGSCLRGDSAPRRQQGQGLAGTIDAGAHSGSYSGQDAYNDRLIAYSGNNTSGPIEVATARQAHGGPHGRLDFGSETFIAGPIAQTLTRGAESSGKGGYAGRRQEDDVNIVALQSVNTPREKAQNGIGISDEGAMYSLTGRDLHGVAHGWAVRRLTPTECERLQGFPDGYTAIPYRNKPAADGPRYKALGNSMAVNVMRVLGERIALVDAIEERAAA